MFPRDHRNRILTTSTVIPLSALTLFASAAARLPSAHDRPSRRFIVNDFTTMITATKNWLRRNRTNFAIGFGVLGVGYVAGQYVLSKIAEAGERMSNERTAKEKSVFPSIGHRRR